MAVLFDLLHIRRERAFTEGEIPSEVTGLDLAEPEQLRMSIEAIIGYFESLPDGACHGAAVDRLTNRFALERFRGEVLEPMQNSG